MRDEHRTGNLNHTFSTPEALTIIAKKPCSNLPEHYFLIEQLAHQLFGCLLTCWTEFEIIRTLKNSEAEHKTAYKRVDYLFTSTTLHQDFHYELIADISCEKRYFYTEFSNQPLLLSDAIVLINIATFIKEHKWYEMLSILDISSKGEHFILYRFNPEQEYPTIISSALIEPYQEKHNWLFFNPFFQSKKWKNESSIEELSAFFPNMLNSLPQSSNQLPCSELEHSIFSSIKDKNTVCGVIRFTINGKKTKLNYYMYLAQKGLANALYNSGRDMIFSIIEQPAMVYFYQAMNDIDKKNPPFIFTSAQDINQTGLITYKGICLTKNTTNVFNQYDFKLYNVKIIQRRKYLKQKRA